MKPNAFQPLQRENPRFGRFLLLALYTLFAASISIATSGCEKQPPIATSALLPAAEERRGLPPVRLNERLYSIEFPRNWGYRYQKNQSGLILGSLEKDRSQCTSVVFQIYDLDVKGYTVQQLAEALGKMNQQRFPNSKFEYDSVTVANGKARRLTVHSVKYMGHERSARFRHVDIPSTSRQWVLAVSIFQPNDAHEKEVQHILASIRFKYKSEKEEQPILKASGLKNQ